MPATAPLAFDLHRHASLASTNDEAKRLATAGAPEGSVVLAGEQTAGRGRRGRSWYSPPGNLYCSLLLRPAVPPGLAAQLSFVAALAVFEAAAGFVAPARLALKWPNDVLLDGRKLAGILLESEGHAGESSWVVVGMGVNLSQPPPEGVGLAGAGAAPVAPEAVLARLTHAFAFWYARWHEAGFGPVRRAWLERAAGLGGQVTVRLADATLAGCFADLSETGALVLEQVGGGRRLIEAGEVFLARAA